MFEPGQKIVCIRDDWFPLTFQAIGGPHPVKDGIYTIKDTRLILDEEFLALVGFNKGYHAASFRPLVSDHSELFQAWAAPVTAAVAVIKRVKEAV